MHFKRPVIIVLVAIIGFYSCHTDEKPAHWAYVTDGIPFGTDFARSDSIPIPDPVFFKFETFMDSVFLHSTLNGLHPDKEDCYERIFFVIPVDSGILNFVMYYTDRLFSYTERFVFISYDLKSKQYSKDPLELDAFCILDGEVKFNPGYRMITQPVFRFDKGKNMFIVKQRTHNGNVYNAVEEHWVGIGPDMNLSTLFVIETLAYVPFDESHKKIVRKLDDGLSLQVTLADNMNNFISEIGRASLFLNKDGLYERKDIQLSDSCYNGILFSCDMID